MENQLENATKFLEYYNEFQKRDLKSYQNIQTELNQFFPTDLLVQYSENEHGFYFNHFELRLNYKNLSFRVTNFQRTGYGFYLTYNLPFINYDDKSKFLKENPQPNNIFKLTEKKIINQLEYEINKFEYLQKLSDSKCDIIKQKENEINKLFPGKDYSFSKTKFKEIQVEKNGLAYIAKLHDSGYISEQIEIGYSKNRLNQFYELTK